MTKLKINGKWYKHRYTYIHDETGEKIHVLDTTNELYGEWGDEAYPRQVESTLTSC